MFLFIPAIGTSGPFDTSTRVAKEGAPWGSLILEANN